MDKKEIIHLLEEMGTLLELQGANPFKSRAFHNASRALEGVTEDIAQAVETGAIRKVKGIGEGIARVVTDLVRTGHSKDYDEVRGGDPGRRAGDAAHPGTRARRRSSCCTRS